MTPATWCFGRLAGVTLVILLVAGALLLFGNEAAPGRRAIQDYVATLESSLRFIRASVKGPHILFGQMLLFLGTGAFSVVQGTWVWLLILPIIVFGPKSCLSKCRTRRIARVEEQIELWINAVANALKASPSLGEAICSTVSLVPAPMSQELDVLVKEYELGTPLDQALDSFGRRINSDTLSGMVVALKIARRSGGNLTEMLEIAAASLREFARLEGVVRTKTAEGKAQAFVIGMIPVPMVIGIMTMEPRFFDPLFHSFVGQLIIAGAVALWAVAILASRKILAVDV